MCSAQKVRCDILIGKPKVKDYLEDLGIDSMIKQTGSLGGVRMWIECISLRIDFNGELLWTW
jgi:hypothetical protein